VQPYIILKIAWLLLLPEKKSIRANYIQLASLRLQKELDILSCYDFLQFKLGIVGGVPPEPKIGLEALALLVG
jgi:hypothetical protein